MVSRGSNQPRLGDYNRTVVIDAVRRRRDGVSRVELGRLTGLTTQTISNITRRLLSEDVVTEAGRISRGPGKPRTLLQIRPGRWHAVGVHVDPATLTVLTMDLTGQVGRRVSEATPCSPTPAEVVERIRAMSQQVAEELEPSSVLGLGVAAPGPLDVASGRLRRPPQLAGWGEVPLRSELQRVTGWPVLLDKDVTAAVTGEQWSTEGTAGDFLYCYLGTGIAAGAVLGGVVQRGASNNVGEVGRVLVTRRRTSDDPAASGRLHTTSQPADLVRAALAAGVLPDSAGPESFTELCRLADAGHRGAARVLRRGGLELARGLAVFIDLLDCDRLVLGGPVWPAVAAHQLPVLRAELPGLLSAREDVEVVSSRIATDGAARGAAALVLDHFLAPSPSGLVMGSSNLQPIALR